MPADVMPFAPKPQRSFDGLDPRRIEEASLNALQTPHQLFYDGWLLRVSPGRAKRARSVTAHFGSTLPLERKIRHCERVYAERGLPTLFRITPFAQPPELVAALAARGYGAFDETLVQVRDIDGPPDVVDVEKIDFLVPTLEGFADAVALLQGATRAQRDAYIERMRTSPQALRLLVAREGANDVGVGMAMLDDRLAGIFSMATMPQQRGRGVATALLARLLAWAWEHAARHVYLQVEATNAPALAVYRKFGFATAYTYDYRGREEDLP